MSRPKPHILVENVDTKTYQSEQVLKAEAIYAVFYDGQAINLKSVNVLLDCGAKYKKTSFSNPGHAFNLAEKLNKNFKTTLFEVHILTGGTKIVEPPKP
jgi:hypothetical protein